MRSGPRAVDQANALGFGATEHLPGEVHFARLGCTDQVVEKVAAAKVARQADLGERGGELGILGRDAHVAGQGERQAGTRRWAGDHRERGLGHLVEPTADFHARTYIGHPVVEGHGRRLAAGTPCKALHVAARAERCPRAGEHHQAHSRVVGQARQGLVKAVEHRGRQRVARFGAVHGQRGDATLNRLQQVLAHGVLRWFVRTGGRPLSGG